jgi:hypothetical protein
LNIELCKRNLCNSFVKDGDLNVGTAQALECLIFKHNAMSSNPSATKFFPFEKPVLWTINILIKNEGQEGKTGPYWRWVPVGEWRA